jgi:hypothetical protein
MSDARMEAGRRNGLLAKGKKSEESRQKCAQNSLKHGLYAETLILANESNDLYESLRQEFYDDYQPETAREVSKVDYMVASQWRINRAITIETETIDVRQARMANSGELAKEFEVVPEPTRLALAYAKEVNESATLNSVARSETRFHRRLMQLSKEFYEHRDRRRKAILRNEGNATVPIESAREPDV